ncbi:hypothetical protein CEV34_2697 [Brucella pseudogrignonensis]|uniref:Antitoxin SocA-like Panacea domain-containing protein n=1 Tax=Brucella pseudogrignonensis TaxID=419475 RepID=A0A256GGV3_9HYPH|nr:hypothetical protein CEV34_2697 [Brucella pseudogrignonensis]
MIAALILKAGEQSLNILKAVKLVYLVDRESIKRYGFPVLEEARVSMPHGPVNSYTYSHINGEYDLKECGWSDFLQDKANHQIALADTSIDLDTLDELSDADLECVDTVWDAFGKMNQWEIRDWTHDPKNIPEWEDPKGGSTVIPLRRILQVLSVENIDEVEETVRSLEAIDQSFMRARVH